LINHCDMALSLSTTRGSAIVRPIVKPTLLTFIQVAPLRASTANMPSRSEFVDFEKDSLDEGAHVREWPMSWGYAALQVRQHKDRARVSKPPGEDSTYCIFLQSCTLRASEINFISICHYFLRVFPNGIGYADAAMCNAASARHPAVPCMTR
jgi:hypothetical protein